MCGSETFAIDVSSTSMNVAAITAIAISHGLWLGCHCESADGLLPCVGSAMTQASTHSSTTDEHEWTLMGDEILTRIDTN
jgi:hypothetical protein